jgi:hypothetical protein
MRRLFGLVLALAVVSAPLALEACQITCESNATPPAGRPAVHDHTPADHPSCHERVGTPQQLSTGSVPCDHGTAATPGLVAAKHSDTAVALPVVVPVRHAVATGESRVSVYRSLSSDRLALPLAIPLRV